MRILALILGIAVTTPTAAFAQSPPARPVKASDLPVSESKKNGAGETIGLSTCFAKGDVITCKFVLTRDASGAMDYIYDPKGNKWTSRLIDDFKIEHQLIGGYLINGRNEHVKKINLESTESLIFSQDYGGGKTDGIGSLRVIFRGYDNGGHDIDIIIHGTLDSTQ